MNQLRPDRPVDMKTYVQTRICQRNPFRIPTDYGILRRRLKKTGKRRQVSGSGSTRVLLAKKSTGTG